MTRRSKPRDVQHRVVPGTRGYKLRAEICDWCRLRKTTHVVQLFGTCAKVPCCARCEKSFTPPVPMLQAAKKNFRYAKPLSK